MISQGNVQLNLKPVEIIIRVLCESYWSKIEKVWMIIMSGWLQHNLRLILFVMNKHFHDFTNGPKFQDLCQAGVKGLMTAIDRFEPKRRFRLSTYGVFWIRHAIIRSMTLSSFTKVSFGLESVSFCCGALIFLVITDWIDRMLSFETWIYKFPFYHKAAISDEWNHGLTFLFLVIYQNVPTNSKNAM